MKRSEAFLMGEPLNELGQAMPLSGASELIISPSAVECCMRQMTVDGRREENGDVIDEAGEELRNLMRGAEEREGGCVCIRLLSNRDTAGKYPAQSFTSFREASVSGVDGAPAVDIKAVLKRADMVIKARNAKSTTFKWRTGIGHVRTVSRIMSSLSLNSASEGSVSSQTSSSTRGGKYLSKNRQSRTAGPRLNSSFGKSPDSINRAVVATALDSLLRFVPDIIKGRFSEGLQLQMLAENRKISTMFLVSDLQVLLQPPPPPPPFLLCSPFPSAAPPSLPPLFSPLPFPLCSPFPFPLCSPFPFPLSSSSS